MTVLKSESKKETEDSHLLKGLKKILVTISEESQDVPVLFLEDEEGDLCSFRGVRKSTISPGKRGRNRLLQHIGMPAG